MQALASRPLQERLLLARGFFPRKLVTLVIYCLVTYYPIKQRLKETNVYYLTLSLWVRNSEVTSLGDSGLGLSRGCNSSRWPVLQLSAAFTELELFVRLIACLVRSLWGRPQRFLTQDSLLSTLTVLNPAAEFFRMRDIEGEAKSTLLFMA